MPDDFLLVPDSPGVTSPLPSPDLRSNIASRSHRIPSSHFQMLSPRFLSDPSPRTILALLEDADGLHSSEEDDGLRTSIILRHGIRWAVEHADIGLIAWFVGLQGIWGSLIDEEVRVMTDDDGWGLVGMAVQSSCGRQEVEEGVRAIVGRWGLEIGPRGGQDTSGWTPLHLAALLSTPPLISFLLTRGASPHAVTTRGLTPLDLVSGMSDKLDVVTLLENATSIGSSISSASRVPTDQPDKSERRQRMLHRRRQKAVTKMEGQGEEDRKSRLARSKEKWLTEWAKVVGVDAELLLPTPRSRAGRSSADSGLGWRGDEDLPGDDEEEEDDAEDEGIGDLTGKGLNDSMLVFSLSQLSDIFDIHISSYRPHCSPLSRRSLPANALFLYARFAHYRCDESWLEQLIEGGVERIEQGVYGNVEDLAHLSFWAYNTTALLHLLRSDEGLAAGCEELNLLSMVEELINAIHVFVIRIAEKRIDSVLDAALLDYETLEDFSDVRFEGEWTLFRSIGKITQRGTILPKASSVFANANGAGSTVMETTVTPGRFGSLRDIAALRSPAHTPGRLHAEQDHMSTESSRSNSVESFATVAATGLAAELSPLSITEMLSGVLLVLQLYEVNPAIIVQAFSQIFFWIASELFNRILTRKKYLCRTKAVQIRMNITVLEDWVRTNGLPAKTATKHLEPVTQLLQWLQCLSQIKDFDSLIGMMQSMKAINPLQMRRAVREYRFEVNEGKMTDECSQYLAQLQKDWERRRVGLSVKAGQEIPDGVAAIEDAADTSTPVDALFDGTTSLAEFVPCSAPECFGELIDSRFMLPFLLPKANAYLMATPPANAAYQSISPPSPFLSDGLQGSRPPSRSSHSSSRPMQWAIPSPRKLRELPSDFFPWLKDRKSELRHHRSNEEPMKKGQLRCTVVPKPSSQPSSQEADHPLQRHAGSSVTRKFGTAPSLDEEDRTPLVTTPSKPSDGYGFPSSGLQTSVSLEILRDQARVPFEAVDKPVTLNSNTYELKIRSAGISRNPSYQPPASPHYELARHRRQSMMSVASPKSAGSPITSPKNLLSPLISPSSLGSNSGKNWWKLARQKSSDNLGRGKASEASEDKIASGVGFEQTRKAVIGNLSTV